MNLKHEFNGISVGTASVITVFTVLCMTVFALLTFTSANGEYALSEKTADNIKNYYTADSKAAEYAAQIIDVCEKSKSTDEITLTLSGENIFTVVPDGENLLISFSVDIDSRQRLDVSVSAMPGKAEITQYKTVSVSDGSGGTPDVWDGASPIV